MGLGVGNIFVGQRTVLPIPPGPPGPPFLLTSADNGLSVDPVSFRIVLGQSIGAAGDPAQLLSNREIPMNGFLFQFGTNADQRFLIDIANAQYSFGDIGLTNQGTFLQINDNFSQAIINSQLGNPMLFLQNLPPFVQLFEMGDLSALQSGIKLSLNLSEATIATFNGNMLLLNDNTGNYKMGDVDSVFNQSTLFIDDANKQITANSAGGLMLFLDNNVGSYFIGDISTVFGGYALGINGANGNMSYNKGFNIFLDISPSLSEYKFGDISATVNGSYLFIDDTNEKFDFFVGLNPFFEIDQLNQLYSFGDINGVSSGANMFLDGVAKQFNVQSGNVTFSNFNIDDTTGTFNFTNTPGTALLTINGVNGFTGTVTPVTTITVNGGIVTNVA